MSTISTGSKQHLKNLCKIFNIPTTATKKDPHAALVILTNLYAMPLIEEKQKRRLYGNEILKAVHESFPPTADEFTSRIHGMVIQHIAVMQDLKHFYKNLNMKPKELVAKYERCQSVAFWLKYIGIGSFGGSAIAGATEKLKGGSLRESIELAVKRAAGQSAFVEALRSKISISSRATGLLGAGLVATGWFAYINSIKQMEEIREIVLHRFQKGEISNELYNRVFSEISADSVLKYR